MHYGPDDERRLSMIASRAQILLVEPACGCPESAMLGETLSGARLVVARGSKDALLQLGDRALGATAVLLGIGSGTSAVIVDAAEVVERVRCGATTADSAAAIVAFGSRKNVRALRDAMGELVDRYLVLPMESAALQRALHLALDRTRLAELRAVRSRAAGRISPSAPWSSGS